MNWQDLKTGQYEDVNGRRCFVIVRANDTGPAFCPKSCTVRYEDGGYTSFFADNFVERGFIPAET